MMRRRRGGVGGSGVLKKRKKQDFPSSTLPSSLCLWDLLLLLELHQPALTSAIFLINSIDLQSQMELQLSIIFDSIRLNHYLSEQKSKKQSKKNEKKTQLKNDN